METALAGEKSDGKHERATSPMMMDFGDYELLGEIGRGGQGVVFRARQKSLNRTVALKVIGLGHWATEAHIKRFRQEAEAAASLDHPRIVPIYEIGERDGSCYFSMKCVEGGQLDEVIRREPMPIRSAAELIVKLAHTLQYAHDRRILHRDIKPGNILLDRQGEPHLTDFGLARLIETESTITRTMEVLGTPSYIAPEQAQGAEVTKATDVYGLGAVLYQLLTGHPPFAGGTTFETIRLVLETEPRNPRLWNPKIDRDLATICLKCLEKDPPRRYSSPLELANDLERWSRHEPIRARRTGLASRGLKWVRRNRAVAALLALSLSLAAAAFMFWRSSPARPPSGIAVLPFEAMSGDKDDALFADGIQDDVLTRVAKIAGLKVISRTSVMQYRGEKDARKIGQALNVSHLLEGSVRKLNGRIRINAQLIDAQTDQHIWAEQYDRDLTDAFTIQSELAQKIANQLSTNITRAERAALETRPTHDLEAYGLYLRGKQLLRSCMVPVHPGDIVKITQGIQLLEKAIARDPEFVLAHCALAEASLDLYWQEPHAPADRARAQQALENARRLDPNAGETHFAQACFEYYGNRNYSGALGELERAMSLLPNSAEVFMLAGRIDRRLNRWPDCIRHYARAIELDPRESRNLWESILTYSILKRYREAEELADRGIATFPDSADVFRIEKSEIALAEGDPARARKTMEEASAAPDCWLPYRIAMCERNFAQAERAAAMLARDKALSATYPPSAWSASIASFQGNRDKAQLYFFEARQAYEKMLHEQPDYPEALAGLAQLDAMFGSKEEAVREVNRAIELVPMSRDPLEGIAFLANRAAVYAWIGQRDEAIDQLAVIVRLPASPSYGELKFDPIWDPLRNDPRFAQLVTEAGEPIPIQ